MAKSSHNLKPQGKKRQVQLQKRDLQILTHVGTFRLTTVDTLKQLFFPQAREDALKSCLRRLRNGFLVAEPLDAKRSYYRLTRRAARLLGFPREVAKPLGRQAKLERYALLWFMATPELRGAKFFNPHDVGLCEGHRLPRHNFFLTAAGGMGYVLVDHSTSPQRLLRKVASKLERFLRLHWFDSFIALEKFSFVVLTPNDRTKRLVEKNMLRRIEPHLRALVLPFKKGEAFPLNIVVHHVPGMDVLLFDQRSGREER